MLLLDLAQRWRVKANALLLRAGFPRDWFLVPLAAGIGAVAGVAAQGYGALVRFSENTFYGRFGGHELGTLPWWLLIALPLAGAFLVGLIKTIFKLPLHSHGIPEVIEALTRRQGKLAKRAGVFTALNSAITIGSGGSAGQEGPIVHIGSVIGSAVGQFLSVGREHMGTLIGCGAAAGLAAIFHAPIAGVLLVLEVVLRDFSFRTFMPVVIAAVMGVAVSQLVGGEQAVLFSVAAVNYQFNAGEILPYLVLGALCGLIGCAFSVVLYKLEHAWHRLHWPLLLKPISGALILGILGVVMIRAFPTQIAEYRPTFFGNGYPVVKTLLSADAYRIDSNHAASQLSIAFLFAIAVCKIAGTSLTLGSGGSGGLFAPSLFIGAAGGGAFGVALRSVGLYKEVTPNTYALAGMAGVLAGAVHCPLTAIMLVFEITHDYSVILPIMLVAVAATTTAQILNRDNVYSLALREMGLSTPSSNDTVVLRHIGVGQASLEPAVIVHEQDPMQRIIDLANTRFAFDFVVCDKKDRYVGIVANEEIRLALLARDASEAMIVGDAMRRDVPTVTPDDTLDIALDHLANHDVLSLPVTDSNGKVLGMLTRSQIMRTQREVLADRM